MIDNTFLSSKGFSTYTNKKMDVTTADMISKRDNNLLVS